jgi:hypothetical protein
MDSLPIALVLSRDAMSHSARSALPDAPVVPHRPRSRRGPSGRATRRRIAAALHRVAGAVEPATP